MSSIWASRLGEVKVGVFPSWFAAVSRMTALIGLPSLTAASRGFRMSVAAPSPRPYPEARESKEKHLPSGDRRLDQGAMC